MQTVQGTRLLVVAAVVSLPSVAGAFDLVLSTALRPPSGARIDCAGGQIRPVVPSGMRGKKEIRSVPEVLIYLKDVEDVEIKNCKISGGERALLVVRGGHHRLVANQIDAHGTAIELWASSHNLVSDNVITFGGEGMMTRGDSDHNRVSHNIVRQHAQENNGGVGVGAFSSPDAAVVNHIVDGELTQVLNSVHMIDDLQVTDNEIDVGAESFGVTFSGRTRNGLARDNRVRGAGWSLLSAGYAFQQIFLPGWCSEDASRRCTPPGWSEDNPDDCFLSGFDAASKGVCVGAAAVDGEVGVVGGRFLDNDVSGCEVGIIAFNAPTNRYQGNDVSGCDVGVLIADFMLESGIVVGNRIHDNGLGLLLSNTYAAAAGATVAFNDFIANATQVAGEQFECTFEEDWSCSPVPYSLTTVLPHNHWGATCEPPDLPASVTTPESYATPVADRYQPGVVPADLGPYCN